MSQLTDISLSEKTVYVNYRHSLLGVKRKCFFDDKFELTQEISIYYTGKREKLFIYVRPLERNVSYC